MKRILTALCALALFAAGSISAFAAGSPLPSCYYPISVEEYTYQYHALEAEIKPDIVYGDGINYPYTWSEAAAYLPKLCAKYMAPEELARMIEQHNDTWNMTSPDIRAARKTAQKSKKVQDRGDSR